MSQAGADTEAAKAPTVTELWPATVDVPVVLTGRNRYGVIEKCHFSSSRGGASDCPIAGALRSDTTATAAALTDDWG